MAREIERKFLVKGNSWRTGIEGKTLKQGYLSTITERVVRVRVIGNQGYLTIKGINVGVTRAEYEYKIPIEDANAMLNTLCEQPIIEKLRYTIGYHGFVWEVDEFKGENQGLIIAEIELSDEGENFHKPDWIGEEVSEDPRCFNSNLIKHPFKSW